MTADKIDWTTDKIDLTVDKIDLTVDLAQNLVFTFDFYCNAIHNTAALKSYIYVKFCILIVVFIPTLTLDQLVTSLKFYPLNCCLFVDRSLTAVVDPSTECIVVSPP